MSKAEYMLVNWSVDIMNIAVYWVPGTFDSVTHWQYELNYLLTHHHQSISCYSMTEEQIYVSPLRKMICFSVSLATCLKSDGVIGSWDL